MCSSLITSMILVLCRYLQAVRQEKATTTKRKAREISRHLKSKESFMSELSIIISRNPVQIIQIKGNPARVPAMEDKPLKSSTSLKSPGTSRLLDAPSAIRIPNCLDLCRKKRLAA